MRNHCGDSPLGCPAKRSEACSRGRKRPIDTDAIRAQSERNAAVLQIFRTGTREDLRALLKTWDYSQKEIEAALKEYDAALDQQSS